MQLVNYIKLEYFSLLYYQYAYVDVDKQMADQLFARHNVRVKFGSEMINHDLPYRFIICKVRKRDENSFLKALGELYDKALLLGYREYENYCKMLVEDIFNSEIKLI